MNNSKVLTSLIYGMRFYFTGAENKLPQRQGPVMGTLVILMVLSQGIKSSSGEIL